MEEVSRAFGVPTVFLAELEDATLSNVSTLERFMWRNTIVPELRLIEDSLNRSGEPSARGGDRSALDTQQTLR
ncbi:MAG: phage portal protein, partial [Chloroflexi bacterium]|nr:phage portal protein [Chloroflexota bacterium]